MACRVSIQGAVHSFVAWLATVTCHEYVMRDLVKAGPVPLWPSSGLRGKATPAHSLFPFFMINDLYSILHYLRLCDDGHIVTYCKTDLYADLHVFYFCLRNNKDRF